MPEDFGREFGIPRIEIPPGMGKKIVVFGIVIVALVFLAGTAGTVGFEITPSDGPFYPGGVRCEAKDP